MQIRGEWWITDNEVSYADGDIGDVNHEFMALQYVVGNFVDDITNALEELGLDPSDYRLNRYDEPDFEAVQNAMERGVEVLMYGLDFDDSEPSMDDTSVQQQKMTEEQAEQKMMEMIGCNPEAFAILRGNGDASVYVMQHEGWIAVRENNAELFGWNQHSKANLASGIAEILSQESARRIRPDRVEIWIYDHATKRSWTMTLAQLEEPEHQMPNPTGFQTGVYLNDPFFNLYHPKDAGENLYSNPVKSATNKWNAAAKRAKIIGPGQDLWRGTSENFVPTFWEWLDKHKK